MANDIALDFDAAGIDVDLHLDEVRTVGESRLARLKVCCRRQPGFNALEHGNAGHPIELSCNLTERNVQTVGPDNTHDAIFELKIALGRFKQLAGNLDRLLAHGGRSLMHRRTCRNRRPAGNGAYTKREKSGVRGFDGDIFDSDAKNVGAYLREHSCVALPLTCRASLHDNFTGWFDAHRCSLEGREPSVLNIAGNATPNIATLPERVRAAPFEIVASARKHRFETSVVVTTVVGHKRAVARFHTGRVGELLLAYETAPAHIGRIYVQLAGNTIGKTFEHKARGRPPRSAHRRVGHQISENHVELDVDCL